MQNYLWCPNDLRDQGTDDDDDDDEEPEKEEGRRGGGGGGGVTAYSGVRTHSLSIQKPLSQRFVVMPLNLAARAGTAGHNAQFTLTYLFGLLGRKMAAGSQIVEAGSTS